MANLFKLLHVTKNNKKHLISSINESLIIYNRNLRPSLASTKTKSEVSGSGRKPWKQKGTGKARAGSIRSPLWRGGGIAFGPKFRKFYLKENYNIKQNAIKYVIQLKKNSILYINEKEILGKFLINMCNKVKNTLNKYVHLEIPLNALTKKNVLLVVINKKKFDNFFKLKSNKNLKVVTPFNFNFIDILKANKIIVSYEALALLTLKELI